MIIITIVLVVLVVLVLLVLGVIIITTSTSACFPGVVPWDLRHVQNISNKIPYTLVVSFPLDPPILEGQTIRFCQHAR